MTAKIAMGILVLAISQIDAFCTLQYLYYFGGIASDNTGLQT